MHIAPSSEKSCNKNILPNQTELGGWYYSPFWALEFWSG